MTAKDAACVLAIDLGTSRVKVGVVNEKLEVLSSSAVGYSSLHGEPHMSEQRTEDWLGALALATSEVMSGGSSRHSVAALALTAQMPTLVSVSGSSVIGNAVTWQDSRADDLVYDLLTLEERRRVGEVAGTPIDGRYIVPMHCRRTLDGGYRPTKVLSAKDYLFFELTGEFATDPSTASGFGCYDLLAQDWSDELCALWGVTADLLPRVEKPTFARPLNGSGAALLTGVPEGTPVLIGAADSVCAHHFVTRAWPQALSVIDGSSTVIMASTEETLTHRGDLLCTPLIEPQHMGAELDLLATGSSISWLANLFSTSPRELEEMAVARRDASRGEVLVFPYLAGGEQGALWRSDLTGAIDGVTLDTDLSDLALALYEGVAFETLRCVRLLRTLAATGPVVIVTAQESRGLVPSLLTMLLQESVIALRRTSPSLLGVALVALSELGVEVDAASLRAESEPLIPAASPTYATMLLARSRRYFERAPVSSLSFGEEV